MVWLWNLHPQEVTASLTGPGRVSVLTQVEVGSVTNIETRSVSGVENRLLRPVASLTNLCVALPCVITVSVIVG